MKIDWIEYNKSWWDFANIDHLNNAWTLVQWETPFHKVQTSLIGDVNELGGECDDCPAIYNESIILRYTTIPKPEME